MIISVVRHRPVWTSMEATSVWTPTAAKSHTSRCLRSEWHLMKARVCSNANTHSYTPFPNYSEMCWLSTQYKISPCIQLSSNFKIIPITFSRFRSNFADFCFWNVVQCGKKTITVNKCSQVWVSVNTVHMIRLKQIRFRKKQKKKQKQWLLFYNGTAF